MTVKYVTPSILTLRILTSVMFCVVYAECYVFYIVVRSVIKLNVAMLSIIMLSVIMLNAIMLNAVMLSVVVLFTCRSLG
jgi:hypothetical protein